MKGSPSSWLLLLLLPLLRTGTGEGDGDGDGDGDGGENPEDIFHWFMEGKRWWSEQVQENKSKNRSDSLSCMYVCMMYVCLCA
jgi:hypothetical protein